jgi:hypothetical protein
MRRDEASKKRGECLQRRKPRRSFDQNETFAALTITNQNQALFLHRDKAAESGKQDGPIDVTLPVFVKLTARSLDTKPGHVAFTGAISKDGADWRTISALTEIEMDIVADIDLRAGLAESGDLRLFHPQPSALRADQELATESFYAIPLTPRDGGNLLFVEFLKDTTKARLPSNFL